MVAINVCWRVTTAKPRYTYLSTVRDNSIVAEHFLRLPRRRELLSQTDAATYAVKKRTNGDK